MRPVLHQVDLVATASAIVATLKYWALVVSSFHLSDPSLQMSVCFTIFGSQLQEVETRRASEVLILILGEWPWLLPVVEGIVVVVVVAIVVVVVVVVVVAIVVVAVAVVVVVVVDWAVVDFEELLVEHKGLNVPLFIAHSSL